jgi:hypothetical protein
MAVMMDGRWLADTGADAHARARQIAWAHAGFLAGRPLTTASAHLRDVVIGSWQRSVDAHVDPDRDPPVMLLDADLVAYRAAHPLAPVIGVLRELVGGVADDGEHLMAVSDAAGRLLWVEGHRGARVRAERMNFVEGAVWDEAHAGTNAPGTALALDHPVQIFATEHFRPAVQRWTCAAAPIHDPATGRILGVVDVTGGHAVAHPYSLALVTAAARAAEGELRLRQQLRPPPAGTQDRLLVLGRGEGALRRDGQEVRLSRRHSELLVLLIAHPQGLSGEQLTDLLYAAMADPVAVRVELARLRRTVGDLVRSRPYRLARPLAADFLDVAAAVRRGDLAVALAAYTGPLLPSSDAPGVVAQRRWLDLQLRSAVLAGRDPDLLLGWAERFGFDDLQLWERLLYVLPTGSPLRPVASARVGELRTEYGVGHGGQLR